MLAAGLILVVNALLAVEVGGWHGAMTMLVMHRAAAPPATRRFLE